MSDSLFTDRFPSVGQTALVTLTMEMENCFLVAVNAAYKAGMEELQVADIHVHTCTCSKGSMRSKNNMKRITTRP